MDALVRLTLQPQGVWTTPWQADSLLGALAVAWARSHGGRTLRRDFLDPWLAGEPPFVISDAFPGDSLPAPASLTLPMWEWPWEKFKEVKNLRWLSPDGCRAVQRGMKPLLEDIPAVEVREHVRMRNSISRDTSATSGEGGELFPVAYSDFSIPGTDLTLYARANADGLELLRQALELLSLTGYGARATTGHGGFEIAGGPVPCPELDDVPGTDGFVALSTFQPADADPVEGYWRSFVKYGKLAPEFHSAAIFKRPQVMLEAGACFRTDGAPKPFYGGPIGSERCWATATGNAWPNKTSIRSRPPLRWQSRWCGKIQRTDRRHPMPKPHTLICTLGTSLDANLRRLTVPPSNPDRDALGKAYSEKDWQAVSVHLATLDPTERVCGAEINSVANLVGDEVEPVNLHLLHSDTPDGLTIAEILQSYFKLCDWNNVSCHTLQGLSDDDPKKFRTEGLRNLAKKCGELVRDAGGPEFCAINATGGYKAQIAIAVLIGQALGIPVYYKHEQFETDAIIRFPPMPVALDFSLWLEASGMFMALSKDSALKPWESFKEDWDERFEPLVNREDVDGKDYLELSPAGQIFHDTFLQRFQQFKINRLPPAAEDKKEPSLGNHGYEQAQVRIENFLRKLTDEVPYVRFCRTSYWNPDLPEATRFRRSSDGVQGIYSEGNWCVKFVVETAAGSDAPPDALSTIATDLNHWLSRRS